MTQPEEALYNAITVGSRIKFSGFTVWTVSTVSIRGVVLNDDGEHGHKIWKDWSALAEKMARGEITLFPA